SDGNKVFSIRTDCGLIEAKFVIEYRESRMTIIIKDIPGDAGNIILKGLKIANGSFEINLNGRKLENCTLEHDTIITDNRIIEERLWRIDNTKIIPAGGFSENLLNIRPNMGV